MIGVFDSGVGGLSVWRELVLLMPKGKYIYVSDGEYCPYGHKSSDFIIERATAITMFLLEKKVDIIVVACNTATAAAISYLREHFSVPFVGMEPAIKPAALHSETGVVGVLATAGTFKGKLYLDTLARFATDVKVIEQVGEGLVELVEEGKLRGLHVEALLHKYIDPMIEQGADHIVLGCTHYPFLYDTIKKIVGERAEIINPAPAVAKQTQKIIPYISTENYGETLFYSTGDIKILMRLAHEIDPGIPKDNFNTIII
ncbi:MAG: glutamate racemase [Bacteroidales bacterium]|jgi:glutamate racemase